MPPPVPPLVAGVAPLALELSANLAGEDEDDDSACGLEGAKERNDDIFLRRDLGSPEVCLLRRLSVWLRGRIELEG